MRVFHLLPTLILCFRPAQPQDQWGVWSAWSSCSRTCGGGITFQQRKCLVENCVGDAKVYRSCNIQDCPNGNGDFRKEQCAEYNSKPYNGKYYQWVPYSGAADNPCSLSCMPKNEFFYATFKEKVVDGTRCKSNSHDMCADGVCKKAGCDLILGSDAKEDKCRVCNGGGANCRTIKSTYMAPRKGRGYVDILAIPPGATNILIQDASYNYIALKDSSTYILNGNRRINPPKKYKGVGATLDYKRKKTNESIFALGPTTDVLYITLLSLGDSIRISYEYSVPETTKIGEHTITYSWKVSPYGICSSTCNGGRKSRRVYCVRDRDNAEVDERKCDKKQKPEETSECNKNPCPPRWFVGSWSPCSRTCGEGTQVRRIHCERETSDGIVMVDERQCSGAKQIVQRKCVELKECPKWKLGKWSDCSQTCGGGVRTRTVQCTEINNNLIDDERCPEHNKPRDQEPCNEIPCKARWVTGDWGECSPSCGKGMRTRLVYCASSIQPKRRYPDYICNANDKPDVTTPCTSPRACPPMWYGSMWSKCTAPCGKGMQMRNVFCGVKEKNNYLKILPLGRCDGLPQLSKIQRCSIKPCYTQWIALSWKPCSTSCGSGKRTRLVKCYADSEEDKTGRSCDETLKPPTEDICNLADCPTDYNRGPAEKPRTIERTPSIPEVTTPPFAPLPTTRGPLRPPPVTSTKRSESLTTTRATTASTEATRPTRPTTVFTARRTPETTARTSGRETTSRGPLSTTLFSNTRQPGQSMKARITRGPTNSEAVVGSDITLPCEATGNPQPKIFWLKGSLDVSVFGQRFQVLPNGYLRIFAVQEVDEDVYTCVANNVISRRSKPAYLSVTTKPYADITLGYTVRQGKEARIDCDVTGKPQPIVQWYKDGRQLSIQDNGRVFVTPRQILIRKTRLEDHGKYTCRATNKNGVDSGHMMLDVLPDEKTRMHDIMNGDCKDDNSMVKCSALAAPKPAEEYCDQPYYQKVCCKTCKARNKARGRLGRT